MATSRKRVETAFYPLPTYGRRGATSASSRTFGSRFASTASTAYCLLL
ncbi:hypothetical protein [Chlorogloeopsis sp. ULAP02]